MARSFLESSSWANMHPKAMSETDKYRSRGHPKIRRERRHSLIFSKTRWQSWSQTVGWLFLRRRKIGSHMSVNLAMKRLMYCNMPRKPLISLLVLGAGMSSMTLIFSGSTSIPRSLTICLSNFLEVTPKVYFLGFNLNLNCLIFSKNVCKPAKWSALSQDFTIMSSIYTSTSLCIMSWNRVVVALW